jgi:hypothetical protein
MPNDQAEPQPMREANREAELERLSRVACSDLLGGIIVTSLLCLSAKRQSELSRFMSHRAIYRCKRSHNLERWFAGYFRHSILSLLS